MQYFTLLLLIFITLAVSSPVLEDSSEQPFQDLLTNLRRKSTICYLRNDRLNEYLYAADGFNDEHGRKAFLWLPGIRDNTGKFRFTPTDGGKNFTIQTVRFNDEYLTKNTTNGEVRFQPNTQTLWQIEPVFCNKVRIVSDGLYLGSLVINGMHDTQRRKVFVKNINFWNEYKAFDVETRAEVWEMYCL